MKFSLIARVVLPLLLLTASAAAAADSYLAATGLNPGFFSGARRLKAAERKGKKYVFRTLVFAKADQVLKLELSSPLEPEAAGKWIKGRLDIYRQIITPYRLDYEAAAEHEVTLKKEFRGEIVLSEKGACPAYDAVIFPADSALSPVTSEAKVPARMAVAGFFYEQASKTLTEAVLYFPLAGFDRRKAVALFRGGLCRPEAR